MIETASTLRRSAEELGSSGRGTGAPARSSVPVRPGPADWLLGALLFGGGAIHLALAPVHLAEHTALGWGFLLSAWAQIGVGVLVVAVPKRWTRGLAAVLSIVLLGAWALSRTLGLPFGMLPEVEDIEVVDAVCALLEVLAVVLAVWLVLAPSSRQHRWRIFATIAATLAIVGATVAISSPSATVHDHGDDDLGFSSLQNGQGADGHTHRHPGGGATQAAAIPMTAAERSELARQLAETYALAERYPTVADAEKAGYWRAGPFSPGVGVHYNQPSLLPFDTDGELSGEELGNPVLIYAGLDADSPLAGFMYSSYAEDLPRGFAGTADEWHRHTNVCIVKTATGFDTPFGADAAGVTDAICKGAGGSMLALTGYMVHVWTVPGYESALGTFSELNPKITCPDGTYHHVPITDLGNRRTACLT